MGSFKYALRPSAIAYDSAPILRQELRAWKFVRTAREPRSHREKTLDTGASSGGAESRDTVSGGFGNLCGFSPSVI
jgi:hypothetical protein